VQDLDITTGLAELKTGGETFMHVYDRLGIKLGMSESSIECLYMVSNYVRKAAEWPPSNERVKIDGLVYIVYILISAY
jgi:hypothetical protein